jgi:hypothetical protein
MRSVCGSRKDFGGGRTMESDCKTSGRGINPNVAKSGGLQSQGVKGEVVVVYRDPLTTQDLKSSGFPDLLGRS